MTQKQFFLEKPISISFLVFQVDPFHTLFGIAGLSLLGYGQEYGIAEVDPVFCMPADVIQRMGINTSYCT